MTNIDTIVRIAEIVGAAVGGGWISHIFSVRAKVRQEKANASKAEVEVDSDKIANLRKMMDDVYRPIIEDLKSEIADLNRQIDVLNARATEQQAEMSEIRSKNELLEAENRALREAVNSIKPDVAPNIRSIQAQHQQRNKGGQFVKSK